VRLLDFCITQILTSAIVIIVRISWLIKVTDLHYVVDKVPKIDIVITFFFLPWRYTTHRGRVFYSPLSGFSLLAYEVT
jgi:hypothetical protein